MRLLADDSGGAAGTSAQIAAFVRAAIVRGLLLTALLGALSAEAADIVGKVVDGNGNAVAEAVVFVDRMPEGAAPPAETRTAEMDQVQKQFVPHVLPVVVGTEVAFPNRDQIHHHVYSFSRSKTFELPLYKGEDAPPVRFDQVGAVKVGCNIHDGMAGVILVVPTPHFAVTDASGSFALRDVPPGAVGIAAWHERQKGAEAHVEAVAGSGAAPVVIELDVAPPRAQPAPAARGGARSYE